jgi:charged multivesicular body protein 5
MPQVHFTTLHCIASQEKFQAPEMDIDAILDMQDDMAEILEESNEINEVLGQDYGIGEDMDEDELLGGDSP